MVFFLNPRKHSIYLNPTRLSFQEVGWTSPQITDHGFYSPQLRFAFLSSELHFPHQFCEKPRGIMEIITFKTSLIWGGSKWPSAILLTCSLLCLLIFLSLFLHPSFSFLPFPTIHRPLQTSFIPLSYISSSFPKRGHPTRLSVPYMFLWDSGILYGGSEVYKFMNFQICKNDCKWHLWKNITGTHFYYLQGRIQVYRGHLFWPSSDL